MKKVGRWPFLFLVYVAIPVEASLGVAVLHTDGNHSAVTVNLPGSDVTFYFPGATRLLRPCTLQTNECPYLELDVIVNEKENNQRNTVIVAKFEDAVGFMELQWFGGGGSVTAVASVVVPILQHGMPDPCYLLDVVNEGGYWVVYCIIRSQHVFRCEMTVNFNNYSNTELRCRYADDANIQNPSIFQYIPNNGYVFFTDGSMLYRINPSDDSLEDFAYLSSSSCRHLNYIPHNHLILYCEGYRSIEIGFDQSTHVHTLNGTGVTYVCEQSEQSFVLKQRELHVEIAYNNQSVNLNTTHFVDTKCITQGNETFIFIIDEYVRVSMLDVTSYSIRTVPVQCSVVSPCRKVHLLPQPTGFSLIVLKEVSGYFKALVFDQNLRIMLSFELENPFVGFTSLYSSPSYYLSSSTRETINDMYLTETEKSSDMPEKGNDKTVIEDFRISLVVPVIIAIVLVIFTTAVIITYFVLQVVRKRKTAEVSSSTSRNASSDNLLDSNFPTQSRGDQNHSGSTPQMARNTVTSSDHLSACPNNLPPTQRSQSVAVVSNELSANMSTPLAQEYVVTGNSMQMASNKTRDCEQENSYYGCNLEPNISPQEVVDGAALQTTSPATSIL